MITKFKMFESENYQFEVGDYVYAIDIDYSNNGLKHDTRYKINKIYYLHGVNSKRCDIETENGAIYRDFFLSRFIPENVYKYNI